MDAPAVQSESQSPQSQLQGTGNMAAPPPPHSQQQQAPQLPTQAHLVSISPTGVAVDPDPEEARRTALLKEFTSHLGVGSEGAAASQARARPELARYLYRNPTDPTGGAICSLPGLDLSAGDDDEDETMAQDGGDSSGGGTGGASALLPDVGTSAHMHPADTGTLRSDSSVAMPPPPPKMALGGGGGASGMAIPAMAASVFNPNDTADAITAANTAQNSMPAASGPGAVAAAVAAVANQSPEAASANAAKLEQAAASNLGTPTTWTRSSVSQAPPSMLRSLSSSFYSLLDSRVRAWTLLLLRHSLSSGDSDSRSRLLALLATSSAIELTKIKMRFQTLELPPAMRVQLEMEKRQKAAARAAGTLSENEQAGRDCDIVLPLIFEADIDISLQGQNVSIQLRAPGTVGADFVSPSSHIKYIELKLDTNSLVASMVEKARLVVFKAVARATAMHNDTSASKAPSQPTGAGLSSFSSALSLGGDSSLQRSKASASAQRLQDIMTKKIDTKASAASKDDSAPPSFPMLGKTRKNRSVTWEFPDKPRPESRNWPDTKRQKTSQTLAPTLKRSYKSFGKPHADEGDSGDRVRNSTFAEFGHAHKHANVPTFRNGRLHMPSANRQGPMDGGGMGRSMGNLSSVQGNATFSFPPSGGGGGNATFGSFGGGGGSGSGSMQALQGQLRNVERFGLVRRGSGGNMGGIGGNTGGGGGGSAPGMPRTATALENMLLSGVTPPNSNRSGNASFGGLRRNN